MAKTNKSQFKPKKKNSFFSLASEKINTPQVLYFTGTIFIVFLIYSFSLFRPWLPFDERLMYKEDFFPIPQRFNEISEIIKTFMLKAHIISGNSLFSNIATLRANPITFALIVFVSFFFKKQAVLYHILQLFIHLVNSALVFLIFKRIIEFISDKTISHFKYLVISFFTLLWALHSTSSEAILLVSNFTTLITYTICLCFILYEIDRLHRNKFDLSKTQTFFLSILFFCVMFFTEYGYTLPFIIFFIVFSLVYKNSNSIKKSLACSIKRSTPYLTGILFFVLFSAFNPDSIVHTVIHSQNIRHIELKVNPVYAFIERNLWLTPQLFVHLLKLMVFPKTLSLFQSNHVYLSDEVMSAYSVFSTTCYIFFLLAPIILFIIFRHQKHSFVYPFLYALYFGIFPFIHAAAPAYCLSADRYCYFPVFLLLIILIYPVYTLLSPVSRNSLKPIIITFSCITLLFGIRTLIRINEWNKPYKLFESAANSQKNFLYKGQRLNILADYAGELLRNQELMESLLEKSLSCLNKALHEFKAKSKTTENQPVTLKIYGLDYKTLTQKAAYSIAVIKNDNYQDSPQNTLAIFEPYIEKNLKSAGINQIIFYSEILLKGRFLDKAKKVLEYGYKKFNYSDEIGNKLAEYYMFYEKDFDKTFNILQTVHSLFPNNSKTLENLLRYYEQKNDLINEARIAYLIGLRKHSSRHYQLAVKIYLDLNQLQLANKSLRKLIRLKEDDPLTLLLTSRYLDLAGQRRKILEVLNTALIASNKSGANQDINVTKSILISLINVHANLGNISNARQFLSIFEKIKGLTSEDKLQIQATKKMIANIESKRSLKSVSSQ